MHDFGQVLQSFLNNDISSLTCSSVTMAASLAEAQ
jgi:hypothetical protein